MLEAAKELDFERAADLRDAIIELKGQPAVKKTLPGKKYANGSPRKRRQRK
jgi:excinuclease ABC subunit B